MNPFRRLDAAWIYDRRWWLSAAVLAAIATLVTLGSQQVAVFSSQVDSLRDTPPATSEQRVFDARYDIWFDPEDAGLQLYKRIEDQFVAEDFVLVAFEETEHPLGVFSPNALQTIAALTERLERVPFVRHVRSQLFSRLDTGDDLALLVAAGVARAGHALTGGEATRFPEPRELVGHLPHPGLEL